MDFYSVVSANTSYSSTQNITQGDNNDSPGSSSKTASASHKRKHAKAGPSGKRLKADSNLLPYSQLNNASGAHDIKNLLNLFSQPSTTDESSSFSQGRGRPLFDKLTKGFQLIPSEYCAYKKHKTEDRIQRLWIFSDFKTQKGHEYGYYTKSKDQDGIMLHGFYCMECSNIRKKREFDASVKFERNGDEIFMSKRHIPGCQPRDNNGRYSVRVKKPSIQSDNSTPSASEELTSMDEMRVQEMVRASFEAYSQQLMASMMDQMRNIVQNEVSAQMQTINDNFEPNY